jgi:hypothetical protein
LIGADFLIGWVLPDGNASIIVSTYNLAKTIKNAVIDQYEQNKNNVG